MSLAYPGPDPSNVKETVGRDAFLDALGDPELRARILERGAPTMDDALRTTMSLELLDKSKENYKKTWRSYDEPFEDEEEGEDVVTGGEYSGSSRGCGQAGEFRGCGDAAAEGVGKLHEGDDKDAEGFWDCQGSVHTIEYHSAEGETNIFQSGSWCTTKQP